MNELVPNLPPRESFEHLTQDLTEIDQNLAAYNSAGVLFADGFFFGYSDSAGWYQNPANMQLCKIFEEEFLPILQARIEVNCNRLNQQYSFLRNSQQTMVLTTVDAIADPVGIPVPLSPIGGVMLPDGPIEGTFMGFDIIDWPQRRRRAHIRFKHDGKMYWAEPTLKNFESQPNQ